MEESPSPQRNSGRVRIPVQMNDNIVDTPPEVREVEERPKGKARFHQNTHTGLSRNLSQYQSPELRRRRKRGHQQCCSIVFTSKSLPSRCYVYPIPIHYPLYTVYTATATPSPIYHSLSICHIRYDLGSTFSRTYGDIWISHVCEFCRVGWSASRSVAGHQLLRAQLCPT